LAVTFRQPLRELVEDDLLPLWADAQREGDSIRTAAVLARTRSIANALIALGGDTMPRSSVAAIDRAIDMRGSGGSKSSLVALLADGHRSYGRGRKRFLNGEYLTAAA